MKKVILVILFIGCGSSPRIQYDGDLNDGGKWHGIGIVTYPSGETWKGQFKDGKPYNGQGVFVYSDNSKYKGEIIDGLKQGNGNLFWSDDDIYEGSFKDDKFNGQVR